MHRIGVVRVRTLLFAADPNLSEPETSCLHNKYGVLICQDCREFTEPL